MSNIRLELEKVAELRSFLGDADPELVHDMLEAETDVYELMDWALDKLADEESIQEAISSRIAALKCRADASERRHERLRSVLLECLKATGERTVRRPEGTLTLKQAKPGILSIDEGVLPERFFVVKKSVSRIVLNEAIGKGEDVPGVILSNGGENLTVRRG